jgi:hypothetical protein
MMLLPPVLELKMQHKFRASSLGLIMTDPKKETDLLSVGAKTYVECLAKQFVYGYDEIVTSKYMEKGIAVEDNSIALYNEVFFTNYTKNTERKTNQWLTGEADIVALDKIIDIKSSWSLSTFPVLADQGKDKGYEWQLRAYMMLWNVDTAELAYCLVDTPDDLIGYEDAGLHSVGHINQELRVTTLSFKRDKTLEEKIKTQVTNANLYFDQVIKKIAEQHTR